MIKIVNECTKDDRDIISYFLKKRMNIFNSDVRERYTDELAKRWSDTNPLTYNGEVDTWLDCVFAV